MTPQQKLSETIQKQWNELAQSDSLGFKDAKEMFECLAMEWRDDAIAELLGFHVNTIRNQRNRLGVMSAWGKKRIRQREKRICKDLCKVKSIINKEKKG